MNFVRAIEFQAHSMRREGMQTQRSGHSLLRLSLNLGNTADPWYLLPELRKQLSGYVRAAVNNNHLEG